MSETKAHDQLISHSPASDSENVSTGKVVKDDDSVPCIVKIEDQEDLDYDIDDVEQVETSDTTQPKSNNENGEEDSKQFVSSGYKNLWVSNIDKATKAADLKQHFQEHGKVISASIVMRVGSQSGCFGHLKMNSNQDALACVNSLNGKVWNNATLQVELTNQEPPKRSDKTKDSKRTNDRKIDEHGEQLLAKLAKRKADKASMCEMFEYNVLVKRPARTQNTFTSQNRIRNMFLAERSRRARQTLIQTERRSRELRPMIERLKATREREARPVRPFVRREVPPVPTPRIREERRVRGNFRRVNVRPIHPMERPISPRPRFKREVSPPIIRRRVDEFEQRRPRLSPRVFMKPEKERFENRMRYSRISPDRMVRRKPSPMYARRSPVFERRPSPVMRRMSPMRQSPPVSRRRPSPSPIPFKRRYEEERPPVIRDIMPRDERRPIERDSGRRYEDRYSFSQDISRMESEDRRMTSHRMSPPRNPPPRRERLSPRPSYSDFQDRRPVMHKSSGFSESMRIESSRVGSSNFPPSVDSKRSSHYGNSFNSSESRRSSNEHYSRSSDYARKEVRPSYEERYRPSPERRSYRASPPPRSMRESEARNYSSGRSSRENRWPDVVDYGHRSNGSSNGSYADSQSSSRISHSNLSVWNSSYDKGSSGILGNAQSMLHNNSVNISHSRHY